MKSTYIKARILSVEDLVNEIPGNSVRDHLMDSFGFYLGEANDLPLLESIIDRLDCSIRCWEDILVTCPRAYPEIDMKERVRVQKVALNLLLKLSHFSPTFFSLKTVSESFDVIGPVHFVPRDKKFLSDAKNGPPPNWRPKPPTPPPPRYVKVKMPEF